MKMNTNSKKRKPRPIKPVLNKPTNNGFKRNLLNQSETLKLLKEKSNVYIVEPDMHNDPHIVIEFPYTNAKEWEQVKELFNL